MISYIFDQKNYVDGKIEYVTLHQKMFSFLNGGSTEPLNFNVKYPELSDHWSHMYEPILNTFLSSLFWGLLINKLYNRIHDLIIELIDKKKVSVNS